MGEEKSDFDFKREFEGEAREAFRKKRAAVLASIPFDYGEMMEKCRSLDNSAWHNLGLSERKARLECLRCLHAVKELEQQGEYDAIKGRLEEIVNSHLPAYEILLRQWAALAVSVHMAHDRKESSGK